MARMPYPQNRLDNHDRVGVSKLIQSGLKAQCSPQPRATPWVNGYKTEQRAL